MCEVVDQLAAIFLLFQRFSEMRRCLFISFLLLGLSTAAQESPSLNENDPRFVGGIFAGGNFTHIINDAFDGIHRVGPNAGGIVYAQIKGQFWSSLAIRFSRKGTIGVRVDSSAAYQSIYFSQYRLRLDYVEAPLLIHAFNKRFYHFSTGFTYSRLLSSNELVSSLQLYRVNNDQFPFRKNNWDFLIGGGLNVNRNLFLYIHFQASIVPVRDSMYVPVEVGRDNQYNRMISLQLAYLFRNSKEY